MKQPPELDPAAHFRWHDGERLVLFGRGTRTNARELLDGDYALLTTLRAEQNAQHLVDGAQAVHHVASGRVDELAATLRPQVRGELLVALGGGRVIDVAKALAAADPPRRVAAIPTTLSGAEMTGGHRHAAGVSAETPRVRPAIVVNDPELSASQPEGGLAESAANALGHAVESPLTPLANPVATLSALASARLLAQGFAEGPARPDRDALALGALLAGYAIGSAGYGLHHVVSQTLARFAGVRHGAANALVLPHTLRALAGRAPAALERLGEALGDDPPAFAARVCAFTGVTRLRDAGVSKESLERCVAEAAERPELHLTPPPASREELEALYTAAY